MSRASIWLLSLLIVCLCQKGEAICDGGWFQHGNSCFKVVTNMKVSWPLAKVYCNAVGGILAQVRNEPEAAFTRHLASIHGTTHLWIGVLDLNNERRWVSSTSHQPVSFTDWGPGEPNNHNGLKENCVWLHAEKDNRWNDATCNTAADFICQKKLNQEVNL